MGPFVEADAAADLAGVEKGSDFSVRLLVEPEADFDTTFPGFEAVKFAVVNLFHRDGDFAIDEGNLSGGRQRAGALLIDETGGDHRDEDERAGVNRGHPETLAPHGPERFAAGGAGGRQFDGLAALHFKQHHQRGQHEDSDEEEKFVADDGANDRHLLPRRGKNPVLGKLVKAGDQKLRGHQEKNRGSDPEEFLQIDLDAALDEHHAEQNGDEHTEDGADKAHQLIRIQRYGGEDQNGFDALPQHHQKDEEEEADPCISPGKQADLAFDFSFEPAAGLHHEDDHGDNENGGNQHDPAFKDVLVPVEAREHDGHGDRSGKSCGQGGVDGFAQIVAADLGQISQGDADDERGFDAFAERNDECLEH